MYSSFLDLATSNGPCLKVWPVPYQGTVSFAAGTKEGPEAILRASYQIETYDAEYGMDLSDHVHFATLPFLRIPVGGPNELLNEMRSVLAEYDPTQDFFLTLGGEHSITLPLLEFYRSRFPNLVVLQIDAHADLRQSYEGSPHSHACIMARAMDLGLPVAQVGIRSLCVEEMQTIKAKKPDQLLTLFAWDLTDPASASARIKAFIANRPLYLTFDVDGLDPSVIPGTGTPEPGGITFSWMTAFFNNLWPGPKLVGMDFCELSPSLGPGVVSESATVKMIVKILAGYYSHV